MVDTPAISVGSIEWLRKVLPSRITEHKAAQEQATAQANAHHGAAQAYQRLLDDITEAAPGVAAETSDTV